MKPRFKIQLKIHSCGVPCLSVSVYQSVIFFQKGRAGSYASKLLLSLYNLHYVVKFPAFRIHLILTWIRILGSTFGKVDPDPRIHLSVIVDPDPRIHIWKKWIRIRVPIFHIFHKEIHVGQIKMLIFITAKI